MAPACLRRLCSITLHTKPVDQPLIAGLVLAAGESSRMGQDKALLLYRGRSFIRNILDALEAGGIAQRIVVLGCHAEHIRASAGLDSTQVVMNTEWPKGQTSSLQCGLRALGLKAAEAVVLCLVDHPAITPQVIRQLCRAYAHSRPPVVIPTFQGRSGHPVLIGSQLFEAILALPPGVGANQLIRLYSDATRRIQVGEPGILLDIDDPAAYNALIQSHP